MSRFSWFVYFSVHSFVWQEGDGVHSVVKFILFFLHIFIDLFSELKEHDYRFKKKSTNSATFTCRLLILYLHPRVCPHFPEGVLLSFNQSQDLRPLQGLVPQTNVSKF